MKTNTLLAHPPRNRRYRPYPQVSRGEILFSPEDADLEATWWRVNRDGYVMRRDSSGDQSAHRLVLSRMLGRPLTRNEICDHINGITWDNRRDNLRLTTAAGNSQCRTLPNCTSSNGRRGVTLHKGGKWQAQVLHLGKRYYLGLFDDPDEAARIAANKRAELGFLERPEGAR